MASTRNMPISSVYGDTGTVEATYSKDLNQIGNDPYVKVSSNSGEFNLFQQMNLNDNFYDSRFEEVYVTQNSAGTGQQIALSSLQFNTMGWARTDRMYLQIPVIINQVISNAWQGFNTDPDLIWHVNTNRDPDITNTQQIIQNGALAAQRLNGTAANSLKDYIQNFTQVDFALMHIFNRIAIYAGNNNQPIGRTQTFFLEGLKTQMREVPWNENTLKILANWGLPISNLIAMGSNGLQDADYMANESLVSTATAKGFRNPAMDAIPDAWLDQWLSLLLATKHLNAGGDFFQLDTTNNQSIYNQSQFNITLPLSYFNNFFRHKTYLPPDFKVKIDIEGYPQTMGALPNFNCPIIAVNNMNDFSMRLINAFGPTAPVVQAFTAGINFSQIKCVYQNHTLRQPLQAQINEKWLSYPIVYNYETFEQYDVDNSGNNSTTMIVRDIAISQQRPTQLIFQIIDTVTRTIDIRNDFPVSAASFMAWSYAPLQYPYALNGANNASVNTTNGPHGTATLGSTPWFTDLSSNAFPITVAGALSTHGTPARYVNPSQASQTLSSNYPMITTISTLIGGRTQYYYKNDTFVGYNMGNPTLNAYDCLIAEQDSECYNDYSTIPNVMKTPLEFMPIGGLGSYQRITIAPGGYVNTADIPTDLGASVIRVQITLSFPLPATKKLQIVKKMPERKLQFSTSFLYA